MSENNAIAAKWEEVKGAVSSLELDLQKNANGNAAAGVRTRKALRSLRKTVTELVKLTVVQDKQNKTAKSEAKAAAKAEKAAKA